MEQRLFSTGVNSFVSFGVSRVLSVSILRIGTGVSHHSRSSATEVLDAVVAAFSSGALLCLRVARAARFARGSGHRGGKLVITARAKAVGLKALVANGRASAALCETRRSDVSLPVGRNSGVAGLSALAEKRRLGRLSLQEGAGDRASSLNSTQRVAVIMCCLGETVKTRVPLHVPSRRATLALHDAAVTTVGLAKGNFRVIWS